MERNGMEKTALADAMLSAAQLTFARLCREELGSIGAGNSIGEYAEKRMHRTIKRFLFDDETFFERRVPRRDGTLSRFIADILTDDGRAFEIQTGDLFPLARKMRFYMEESDLRVFVVHPLLAEKHLTRLDAGGAPKERRKSPLHENIFHGVAELKPFLPYLTSPRLSFRFLFLAAEEYRLPARRRTRRYECLPTALLDDVELNGTADYAALLPQDLPAEFTAKEFGRVTRLSGYALYDALAVFCGVGALRKEGKRGRAFLYLKMSERT